MNHDLDGQADLLAAKTRHYMITMIGKVPEEADSDEFYRALSYALREEIMIHWLASSRTWEQHDARILYYLSMEFLPGRIFTNHITNLAANDVVRLVLHKMNRSFIDIANREMDPGLGNGGLGRLASCFLDSLATLNYPSLAYGLRYQYGIFEQQLWDGVQVEAPDCWLLSENPWEFRRDLRKVLVKYRGETVPSTNIHGDEILDLKCYEEVSALPFDIPIVGYGQNNKFSCVTLRLWTTKESPRNFQLQRYNAGQLDEAAENTILTDVLYPNDNHETGKRIRLKQEFLLVTSSLQDIIRRYLTKHENFRLFSDKVRIQINDTHPALVIPELIRLLTKRHDIPWKMALEMTVACTGYTNHTILKEALEEWDQKLFYALLPRQYRIIERLNHEFCNTIRNKFPDDETKLRRMSILEDGVVRMANLSIVGSHAVNGVAKLHTEILKREVFHDFYELWPKKFINITNGVTPRRWLLHCNPDLARFITRRIGNGWITNFSQIEQLRGFAGDPEAQEEIIQIKRKNKHRLIEYLNQNNKIRDCHGKFAFPPPIIDINSLFDVQIKRVHEYKRQLMFLLHIIMLYQEILENSRHERIKRTFIFGGKAAAGYETAKTIIRLCFCMARKINRDPDVGGNIKIVLVENYNVTKAEMLIPAAELSEQISVAGMEASGTGNMKLSMNGALTIGTDDGANIEMRESVSDEWWPFRFGHSADEIKQMKLEDSYHSKDILAHNPKIRKAVDSLRNKTFAINEEEHHDFSELYHKLIEMHYGGKPDRFFALKDLESYYETQKQVEILYQEPLKWAEYSIHNIAGMGLFSTDNSIHNYNELVWGLTAYPSDDDILQRIRHEYSVVGISRLY